MLLPIDGDLQPVDTCDVCEDLPAAPVLDSSGGTVASWVPEAFSTTDSQGTGPCVVEPEPGALIPKNWLRPRFRWQSTSGSNIFEIRLSVENQANDLVLYTRNLRWTMPAEMWEALAKHSAGEQVTATIRGAVSDGNQLVSPPTPTTDFSFTIAPVEAAGTIVYWTTTGGALKGFSVGEEGVVDVLTPSQLSDGPNDPNPTRCVGCHNSTPDGNFIGFSHTAMAGNGDPAKLGLRAADGSLRQPDFLSQEARGLIARNYQQLPTFSSAHWRDGDRVMLSMFDDEIVWTDLETSSILEGEAYGILRREGDSGEAVYPSFAHGGRTVVYTSSPDANPSGVLRDGDLYTVPYNDRMGGIATPLAGASESGIAEYYPAYSPDDELVTFTSKPSSAGNSYSNDRAEIYVVPSDGGEAVRIAANDPPACMGNSSPGIQNSWSKWAPQAKDYAGSKYYWLVFSSSRDAGVPQLYVAAVVVDGARIKTYPAVYFWNQPPDESNHIPAWDVFEIPAVVPR